MRNVIKRGRIFEMGVRGAREVLHSPFLVEQRNIKCRLTWITMHPAEDTGRSGKARQQAGAARRDNRQERQSETTGRQAANRAW